MTNDKKVTPGERWLAWVLLIVAALGSAAGVYCGWIAFGRQPQAAQKPERRAPADAQDWQMLPGDLVVTNGKENILSCDLDRQEKPHNCRIRDGSSLDDVMATLEESFQRDGEAYDKEIANLRSQVQALMEAPQCPAIVRPRPFERPDVQVLIAAVPR